MSERIPERIQAGWLGSRVEAVQEHAMTRGGGFRSKERQVGRRLSAHGSRPGIHHF